MLILEGCQYGEWEGAKAATRGALKPGRGHTHLGEEEVVPG